MKTQIPIVTNHLPELFELTNEQIDHLIALCDSGHNSYADFKETIPDLNSQTFYSYLADDYKLSEEMTMERLALGAIRHSRPHYFKFESVPNDFVYGYEFKLEDRFLLDVAGLNRSYMLKKELQLLKLTEDSAASSKSSAKSSLAAAIIAALGLVIALVPLLQPVLSQLLH